MWLYAKSSEVYESRYNSSIGSSAMGGDGGGFEAKMFDLYVSYAKEDAEFVDNLTIFGLCHVNKTENAYSALPAGS
jgi:hypothetical protein